MKTKTLIPLLIGLCLISPFAALAQFSSGSTGADGGLNVTTSTNMVMPPNGIFNFTTINVAAGATVTFTKNALNTPVYLLAAGNVVVAGTIDVSGGNYNGKVPGVGGPGGFDGGFAAFQGFPDGPGQGPGGGYSSIAAGASYSSVGITGNTNIYGNTLLSPLIGGSGGSAGESSKGGGGGGGAILIASSTRISVSGSITSKGGYGYGAGSGGAIRLVSSVVDGNGSLNVDGGKNSYNDPNGSNGRTRIDSVDRFAHRNLTLGGKGTRGSQMFVFQPGNPHLDIISAAGTTIIEGTNAPVAVTLPVGSSTNQIVRVQARGFTGDVAIRVKITPENAPSAVFDGVILQSSGNPPFADIQVTLPVDTVTYVHAWTR